MTKQEYIEKTKLNTLKENIELQEGFLDYYKENYNEEKGYFIFKSETLDDAWWYPQNFPYFGFMEVDGEVGDNKGQAHVQFMSDSDDCLDIFYYVIEENEEYDEDDEDDGQYITYIWPDLLDKENNKKLIKEFEKEQKEKAKELLDDAFLEFKEKWNELVYKEEYEKAKRLLSIGIDDVDKIERGYYLLDDFLEHIEQNYFYGSLELDYFIKNEILDIDYIEQEFNFIFNFSLYYKEEEKDVFTKFEE